MNLREHRIPVEEFSELSEGGGGVAVLAELSAAQHSKHILLVRGVLEAARANDHPDADVTRRAYDLLASVQRRHPEVVGTVLRHPSVGAWARRTVKMLGDGDADAAPGQLAAVAAAAAIRSGTACEIDVPAVKGVVTLPSLGQAVLSPTVSTATVECAPDGTEVTADGVIVRIPRHPHRDAPGWKGLRSLSTRTDGMSLNLLIDDLDPYRMPQTANIGARLTEHETARWQSTLDRAWELMVRHHEAVAREVSTTITVLTPLVTPAQGQTSSSSRETFGCVALSTPPDATTLAVTLTHETQHAKLSALLDLVPLTLPDDGSRYYAPWREDPRPVPGLLQGAYAFLGVAGFWGRQRHLERGAAAVHAGAEFFRWREAARLVTDTLHGSGRLTTAGETFTAGMARRLDEWSRETVPADARDLALERAEQHRARWLEQHA